MMCDDVKFEKPRPNENASSCTLPGMSHGDPRWIIDVMEDLSAFARQYCSVGVHQELKATTNEVRRLISIDIDSRSP